MNLVTAFWNKTRDVGIKKASHLALRYVSNSALTRYYSSMARIDYRFNKAALKQSIVDSAIDNDKIRQELSDKGFGVIDYQADKEDFNHWLEEIGFPLEYSKSYGEVFTEKALEHYLSAKILELKPGDVFIDVAAATSPWYDLSEKYYQCRSIAIDLRLPAGENDSRKIECDATATPFEKETIDKMALHCALEVFENDDDIDLVKEAARVLKPGGKLVIVPLYMDHFYGIRMGLKSNRKGISLGDAKVVWNDVQPKRRFCRYYDVAAFERRISEASSKMETKIYMVLNETEMKQAPGDRIYVKFAACLTRKHHDTGK